MMVRHLHRLALLAATGGIVFQTTTSCASDVWSSFASSAIPTLTSSLNTLITNAVQGDSNSSTTSSLTSVCPDNGSVFSAVCSDVQGVNAGMQQPTTSGDTSSSTTGQ